MSNNSETSFKAGFIAVVGRPNVGKSTLVNALLGEKVSIVSPKANTTRTRIHAILNGDNHQAVLIDTPGFCGSETPLRKVLRRLAGNAPKDADLTMVVTDIVKGEPKLTKLEKDVISAAKHGSGDRVVLVLNKVDRLKRKDDLLPWMAHYQAETGISAIIPVSALKKDGLDKLESYLLDALPESEAIFPRDLHTDQAERLMCEELLREQILLLTHQEVPHSVAVVIESFLDERPEEGDGGLCSIEGKIVVERDSHKKIVIGKKGLKIKDISTRARREMESLLGSKVFLRMTVLVDDQWTKRAASLRKYGIQAGDSA